MFIHVSIGSPVASHVSFRSSKFSGKPNREWKALNTAALETQTFQQPSL